MYTHFVTLDEPLVMVRVNVGALPWMRPERWKTTVSGPVTVAPISAPWLRTLRPLTAGSATTQPFFQPPVAGDIVTFAARFVASLRAVANAT